MPPLRDRRGRQVRINVPLRQQLPPAKSVPRLLRGHTIPAAQAPARCTSGAGHGRPGRTSERGCARAWVTTATARVIAQANTPTATNCCTHHDTPHARGQPRSLKRQQPADARRPLLLLPCRCHARGSPSGTAESFNLAVCCQRLARGQRDCSCPRPIKRGQSRHSGEQSRSTSVDWCFCARTQCPSAGREFFVHLHARGPCMVRCVHQVLSQTRERARRAADSGAGAVGVPAGLGGAQRQVQPGRALGADVGPCEHAAQAAGGHRHARAARTEGAAGTAGLRAFRRGGAPGVCHKLHPPASAPRFLWRRS